MLQKILKKKKCSTKEMEAEKKPTQFLYQAIIQAEVGQYVQINLFDKDETIDDEILGRWDHFTTF